VFKDFSKEFHVVGKKVNVFIHLRSNWFHYIFLNEKLEQLDIDDKFPQTNHYRSCPTGTSGSDLN